MRGAHVRGESTYETRELQYALDTRIETGDLISDATLTSTHRANSHYYHRRNGRNHKLLSKLFNTKDKFCYSRGAGHIRPACLAWLSPLFANYGLLGLCTERACFALRGKNRGGIAWIQNSWRKYGRQDI